MLKSYKTLNRASFLTYLKTQTQLSLQYINLCKEKPLKRIKKTTMEGRDGIIQNIFKLENLGFQLKQGAP